MHTNTTVALKSKLMSFLLLCTVHNSLNYVMYCTYFFKHVISSIISKIKIIEKIYIPIYFFFFILLV